MFVRASSRLGLNLALNARIGRFNNVRKTLNEESKFKFINLTKRYQSKYTTDSISDERIRVLEGILQRDIIQGGDRISDEKVFNVCQSIMEFQKSIYDYNKINPLENKYIIQTNEFLQKALNSSNVEFSDELLKKLYSLQPQFHTLKAITIAFYRQGSGRYIPSELSMIPFRKMIWDAQFQHALDFVELTNGHANYIKFKRGKLMNIVKYFGGSMVGLIACLHGFITVFFPELIDAGAGGTSFGIYGIYACIVTYFINCGFLGALAFSSKGLENGNLMFQNSTMPYDWYMKVDQMKMCSKIVEADAEINGLDGFATREVVKRVQEMGFEVNEPEQEVMLRQYWYSSGEGFVWVEPDIDPAEVEWWKHLNDIGVKKVWDKDFNKIESAEASEDVTEKNENGDEEDLTDILGPRQ